ncbi:MAG: hypothetical protein K2X99_02715 [Gemmatimonadaceae bacterium]|nr:hypothetical protein [Gemmatimonadaceae bacterium]
MDRRITARVLTPSHRRIVSTVVVPLLLSGCMMAGMGHATSSSMPRRSEATPPPVSPTTATVVIGEIRMTVDFRPSTADDSAQLVVAVVGPRPLSGRDVDLTLTIVPVSATTAAVEHGSDVRRRQSTYDSIVLSPVEDAAGPWVFRPVFPRNGPFRLTVGLRRAGTRTFLPPIEVAQVWDLSPTPRAMVGASHSVDRSGLTPLVILGAGLMAVMMLVGIR